MPEDDSSELSEKRVVDVDTTPVSLTRDMIELFESFQRSRTEFSRQVVEYSDDVRNSSLLHGAGASELLKHLLLDPVKTIRLNSALALGKLAAASELNATDIMKGDTLQQLVYTMQETSDKQFKKAAAYILRSIAKHNSSLAASVVESGSIEIFVNFLNAFDSSVKEEGAWAIDYICRHNAELAQSIVDYGAIPFLVQCVQEPELSVKRIAICTLADIAKHSQHLAQLVIDAEGVRNVIKLIDTTDILLKRQVWYFLTHIGKHSKETANLTVESDVIISLIHDITNVADTYVLTNIATFIGAISAHGKQYANLFVDRSVLKSLVLCISDRRRRSQYAACYAIGQIAATGEDLAKLTMDENVTTAIMAVLVDTTVAANIKARAAWCLGMVGSQSSSLSHDVCEQMGLLTLYELYITDSLLPMLRKSCEEAMERLISKCRNTNLLFPLLSEDTHPQILEYVVKQLSIILPSDAEQKLTFMSSKMLELLQRILKNGSLPSSIHHYVHSINGAFPVEAVKYYTPGYEETLLSTITSSNGSKNSFKDE